MLFKDRTGTNLNRKRIKIITQTPTEIIADIERADNVTEEGTAINAAVFNAFQTSIDTALNNASSALTSANQASSSSTNALNLATSANTNASNALQTAQEASNRVPTFTLNGTSLTITTN